jgi:hypothetical protein
MIDHLRTQGPVGVGIHHWISNDMGRHHGNGIYRGPAFWQSYLNTMSNAVGGHCVLIIGYGREMINGEEVFYWLIQNTYGVGWGNNGVYKFDMSLRDLQGNLLINGGWGVIRSRKRKIKHKERPDQAKKQQVAYYPDNLMFQTSIGSSFGVGFYPSTFKIPS